jgi:hypothetical protein
MHTVIAASMFDNPWVLAAVLLVSGVASWLSKRRQEKQAQREAAGEEPPAPSAAGGGVSLEETIRRLLGEEPQGPAAPPPIPRPAVSGPAPVTPRTPAEVRRRPEPSWTSEEGQEMRPAAPVAGAPSHADTIGPVVRMAPAAVLSAYGSARAATLARLGPVPVATGPAAVWRHRSHARQAFVASVVFAPPKGLPHDAG